MKLFKLLIMAVFFSSAFSAKAEVDDQALRLAIPRLQQLQLNLHTLALYNNASSVKINKNELVKQIKDLCGDVGGAYSVTSVVVFGPPTSAALAQAPFKVALREIGKSYLTISAMFSITAIPFVVSISSLKGVDFWKKNRHDQKDDLIANDEFAASDFKHFKRSLDGISEMFNLTEPEQEKFITALKEHVYLQIKNKVAKSEKINLFQVLASADIDARKKKLASMYASQAEEEVRSFSRSEAQLATSIIVGIAADCLALEYKLNDENTPENAKAEIREKLLKTRQEVKRIFTLINL